MIKSKTFWTGIAGVVGAAGAYATGQTDLWPAVQMGLTSLLAIFLRHGISKNGG